MMSEPGFDPRRGPCRRARSGLSSRKVHCANPGFTLFSPYVAMAEVLDDPVAVSARSLSEDDRRLIRSVLAGDAEAIATLDSWIQAVLRSEFHRLREEWDDLRQEIRLRVYRNLRAGRFHGASELRTYVHRIARNTCIDAWRRSATRPESAADRVLDGPGDVSPDATTERLVSRDLLRKILLGSTPEERLLLKMVHAEHLSYAEIARRLGVAEGTIKARVFRCRDRLLAVRRRLLAIGKR